MHQSIETPKVGREDASTVDNDEAKSAMPNTETASFMEILEAGINRGQKFVQDHPAIALVGVASICAVVVIAAKQTKPTAPSLAGYEQEVRQLNANSREHGQGAINSIATALSNAINADPKILEPYLAMASEWASSAQASVKSALNK